MNATSSQNSTHAFLRKSKKIGSVGTLLAYGRDQRVFHASDIPERAKSARIAVLESKKPGTVRWRQETYIQRPCSRRSLENFDHDPTEYRHNFRAEELPKPRDVDRDAFGRITRIHVSSKSHINRTMEAPVSSKLEGKTNWDFTISTSGKERERKLQEITAMSRNTTLHRTERLLGPSYIGIYEREVLRMETFREERRQKLRMDTDYSEHMKQIEAARRWKGGFLNSVSRREHIVPADASIRPEPETFVEQCYEETLKQLESTRNSLLSSKKKRGTQHTYYHTGTYEAISKDLHLRPSKREGSHRFGSLDNTYEDSEFGEASEMLDSPEWRNQQRERKEDDAYSDDEKKDDLAQDSTYIPEPFKEAPPRYLVPHAWSCCGAYDYNAKGCMHSTVTEGRWNYSTL